MANFKNKANRSGGLDGGLFQGLALPNLADAAAFCLALGSGLAGTVSDIWDLPGRDHWATRLPFSLSTDKSRIGPAASRKSRERAKMTAASAIWAKLRSLEDNRDGPNPVRPKNCSVI